MTDALRGEGGAYTPCFELPAPLPAVPEGAIVGTAAGFVPRDAGASPPPVDPFGAVVGGNVGFVARPCCECGVLPGSSGLVNAGSAIGGTHTIVQGAAGTLQDAFGRTIPYDAAPTTPGPLGLWYQIGVADTGQQWWSLWQPGAQLPPPPNSVEIDGSRILLTVEHNGGVQIAARINHANAGGFEFEHYDFAWHLADHGFDVTVDVEFSNHGSNSLSGNQFTLAVQLASPDQSNFPTALVAYRQRRSTDNAQLFMGRGTSPTLTFTRAPLVAGQQYRIRWQVDGPMCNSRVRIWPLSSGEPSTWDGETTLAYPMQPNAAFYIAASSIGSGVIPRTLTTDNVNLLPLNLGDCRHYTVCEDSVTQLGPRQFQLANSYLPRTIVAFVNHAGYPLVLASASQGAENIIEDDPVAGIFSFPASISYSPAYNPTITTGTVITACYIVPPG